MLSSPICGLTAAASLKRADTFARATFAFSHLRPHRRSLIEAQRELARLAHLHEPICGLTAAASLKLAELLQDVPWAERPSAASPPQPH